jgi:HK97 family phage major capsid protein
MSNVTDILKRATALAAKERPPAPATPPVTAEQVRQWESKAWMKANAHKDGSPRERGFADWLDCVKSKNTKRLDAEYQTKATMGAAAAVIGGYLIPPDFQPMILGPTYHGIIWPRALKSEMKSSSQAIPGLNVNTAPTTGNTAFFGGITAAWGDDTTTLKETEPSFNATDLQAHDLTAYAHFSNAVFDDGIMACSPYLERIFGKAFKWFMEQAFLMGSGVNQPEGICNSPAAISVPRQNFNQFTLQDAANMLAKLLPGWNIETTCWIVSPTVHAYLWQIAAVAAQGAALTLHAFGGRPQLCLLGIPVETSEALPALGYPKDVMLVDVGYYLIGDRQEASIFVSHAPKFTQNISTWKIWARVAGRCWLQGPITLSDGTSTASPYVYLHN